MASPKMPAAAMIVAIVNLVLFVPCLGSACFNTLGGASGMDISEVLAVDAKAKEQAKKINAAMDEKLPNRRAVEIVFSIAGLIYSVAMIFASIGLLLKKPWGRSACLLAAALVIVVSIARLGYSFVALPPAIELQEAAMKEAAAGPAPPPGTMAAVTYGMVGCSGAFMIGYPLLVIILMMTGSVRAFYSTEAYDRRLEETEGGGRDDNRRDDEDDRRDDDYGR